MIPAGAVDCHVADDLESAAREHWWAAVAALSRRIGDLEVAEDAVQEACTAAITQWPRDGAPPCARAWLIATAWHKAVDVMRRDHMRAEREAAAARELAEVADRAAPARAGPIGDDELALIFACCHPALDPAARVALTLRSVCGLATGEIADAFLVSEAAMAQRLVRAKRKIREAGIPLTVPGPAELAGRLAAVLRVVYLVFTQGHRSASGTDLIRANLCDQAIRLARALSAALPGEPEVTGLLALLLLTDARRPARIASDGSLILLAEQDRSRWDQAKIAEGQALVEVALRSGRPGPYQVQAAIAACHCAASSARATDWPQIAALYTELGKLEPTPVVAANQAVAIAMAGRPEAGLAILDRLAEDGRLRGWAQMHIARAELLRKLDRGSEAVPEYEAALAAGLAAAERAVIESRMRSIR